MTAVEISLRLAGATQIVLVLAHLDFGRRFDWANELSRLSLLNRQIFQVHCFFVCIVLLLMGGVSLFAPEALLERSHLGLLVAAAVSIFWLARLFVQWFVYDPSLWRGKRFETAMHGIFTVLWSFYSAVYLSVFLMQWR